MKTLIGVLASRDDADRDNSLARLFETLCAKHAADPWCPEFAFAFTGGTYDRIIGRTERRAAAEGGARPVNDETWDWLHNTCGALRLPEGRAEGGGTLLGCMVAQGMVRLVWPFFSPSTSHWLSPDNLALMRLCDLLQVGTYMNAGSVREWADWNAQVHGERHPIPWPPTLMLPGTGATLGISAHAVQRADRTATLYRVAVPSEVREAAQVEQLLSDRSQAVIALIAHDEMKAAMGEFVYDHRDILGTRFSRILCTGTTGKVVLLAAPSLETKIHRYKSGPHGGDVQIATEVLYGQCQVVVFFTDPLRAHPHTDDIRAVLGACMLNDQVRLFSSEHQARMWFGSRFGSA